MQPQAATVRKAKRALSLAQNIVRDIEAGAHSPGDRLPQEDEMLARYEVARATLREALRFLELQGVIHLQLGRGGGPVVARPQTGDFVNSLSLILHFMDADLRGLLELREAIAPDVAGYAAERATTGDRAAHLSNAFADPSVLELTGIFCAGAGGPAALSAPRSRGGPHRRCCCCEAGDGSPRFWSDVLSCRSQSRTAGSAGQVGANPVISYNHQ